MTGKTRAERMAEFCACLDAAHENIIKPISLKANGPAEAATSPDRGSKSLSQGNENMKSNSTGAASAPDFPIPYTSQGPEDDMRDAMALFDLLDCHFDEGCSRGITKDTVCDIVAALAIARGLLRPVLRYLADDARDETPDLYRAARRAEILSSFERFPA